MVATQCANERVDFLSCFGVVLGNTPIRAQVNGGE